MTIDPASTTSSDVRRKAAMKQKQKPLKFVSAFSGIGGIEVGLRRHGIKFPTFIEKDEPCQRVLSHHFPKATLLGDIYGVSASQFKHRVDGIAAGFPCKGLSLGKGNRQGLRDPETKGFFEFIRLAEETLRLAEETNPRWLVLENSAELVKFNKGRDLLTVLCLMEQLGYGWAFRVVDAGYFGSPQWRRRIIVVGHLGGDPRPAGEVLGLHGPGAAPAATGADRRPDPGPSASAVAVRGRLIRVWRKSANSQVSIEKGFEGGYRETWVNDGRANALTGYDWGNAARQKHLIFQNNRLRTLSLTEWERLQGFEDDWTLPARTDGERGKQIGNAVHTGMSDWVGEGIVDVHYRLPMLEIA